MDYWELRIYTKGEKLISKRDGQTYTVTYWASEANTYTMDSRYVRVIVSAWDMDSF